jgi:hypothetical protein
LGLLLEGLTKRLEDLAAQNTQIVHLMSQMQNKIDRLETSQNERDVPSYGPLPFENAHLPGSNRHSNIREQQMETRNTQRLASSPDEPSVRCEGASNADRGSVEEEGGSVLPLDVINRIAEAVLAKRNNTVDLTVSNGTQESSRDAPVSNEVFEASYNEDTDEHSDEASATSYNEDSEEIFDVAGGSGEERPLSLAEKIKQAKLLIAPQFTNRHDDGDGNDDETNNGSATSFSVAPFTIPGISGHTGTDHYDPTNSYSSYDDSSIQIMNNIPQQLQQQTPQSIKGSMLNKMLSKDKGRGRKLSQVLGTEDFSVSLLSLGQDSANTDPHCGMGHQDSTKIAAQKFNKMNDESQSTLGTAASSTTGTQGLLTKDDFSVSILSLGENSFASTSTTTTGMMGFDDSVVHKISQQKHRIDPEPKSPVRRKLQSILKQEDDDEEEPDFF